MKLNIDELENMPEKLITYTYHELIKELNNGITADGLITAYSTGYGIRIEGHIETDIELECDRCLEAYSYHVNIDIDETFIKDGLMSESIKELELTKENFVEELNGREDIDITDLVYQSILLNIPTKKLCNVECNGSEEFRIFQTEENIDPRMEVFKTFSDYKADTNNQ